MIISNVRNLKFVNVLTRYNLLKYEESIIASFAHRNKAFHGTKKILQDVKIKQSLPYSQPRLLGT